MAPMTTIDQFMLPRFSRLTGRYIGKLVRVSNTITKRLRREDSQKHDNNQQGPSHRNYVDRIAKPAKIKVRMRWQDFAASYKKNNNWDRVSDLEANPTTTDDCLESVIASEDNETEYEVYDEYTSEGAKRNAESVADLGEPGREWEGFVASHTPGKSGCCCVRADDDEVL